MFQSGKEVREPIRKASVSSDKAADAPKTETSPTTSTSTSTTASSAGGPASGRRRVRTHYWLAYTHSSLPPSREHMVLSALIPRRFLTGIHLLTLNTQSSAASQGGLFSGLLANRSGDEYTQRRQSWAEMKKPEGLSQFFSGLVNKPSEKK